MKLRRFFYAKKLKKNTMNSQTLDKQFAVVEILCNKYLQKDRDATRLLNKIFNIVADFSLIDERAAADEEFDYAEELQELIFTSKMMYHQMQRHNLLLMGNYGEYVTNQQDKHAD